MNGIFHGRVSMRGTRFGRGVLFGSFGASTAPVGTPPTDVTLSAASILETALPNTIVATISSNGDAPWLFSIIDDPDSKFRIVGSNLVLDQPLDYETATSHNVTIRAANLAGFHDKELTISVIDVVEAVAPTVVNLSTASVLESAGIGSVVATISSDGTAPVTYSIEADPDGKFRIEGSNLVLDQAIDFETDTEHPVTIRATNAAGSEVGTFTISVTDVAEAVAPTVVNLSSTSVSESASVGAVVATISSDGTAPVTYTIESDPDGKFAINGNALELAATIDFATDNEHPVTIRATNAAGSEVGAFTISVTQVVSAAIIRGFQPDEVEDGEFDFVVDDVNGNDSLDGLTLGTAKETLAGALAVASGGDKIAVRNVNGDSIYREAPNFAGLSGTPGNPTVIKGYLAEKPKFSAAEPLTGAVPCDESDLPVVGPNWNKIYKVVGLPNSAIAEGNPRGLFLFENGRRMAPAMARNANPQIPLSETNTKDWPEADETVTVPGPGVTELIIGYRKPELTDQFTPAQIENCDVIYHRDPNGTSRTPVASFDTGTKTINLTDVDETYESNDNKDRFVLINLLPVMRRGQWGFVDNGTTTDVYFWPYDPLQVDVSIEYSARGKVFDVSNEEYMEFRSLKLTRASSGNFGASADGAYAFVCDRSGSTRGNGIKLYNLQISEVYRSVTGYGAFWINNMDNCLVEQCSIVDVWGAFAFFFQGELVTKPVGMSDGNRVTRCHMLNIDKSPSRFYGQQNCICDDSIFEFSGVETHANMLNAYESASYVLFAYNFFFGCGGRAVWQEASNIYLYMNWMTGAFQDADGRTITDQNNATASPGEFWGVNSDCYMIGNMCAAFRNGAFFANGGVFGTNLWTLTNVGAMNNIINGMVFRTGRDIPGGVKTNLLTSGAAFDPSDVVVSLPDVFEDYIHGDVQEKVTSPARTATTTSVVTLPGTDGPITLESKFPDFNFDRDASGAVIDRANPPMGPLVDHDNVPDHGPFWIYAPTLTAMPVVGNSMRANDDYYLSAKPFPTDFDIKWIRTDDQYAIVEDWEEISGAINDEYVPAPGDVGYYLARGMAPQGTDNFVYSSINAPVIAAHPITTPTLLAEFSDGATKAALEWTETGTFTPIGQTLVLFTSFNDNIAENTITATVGAQGRANGTGTPIALESFVLRNTRNQTVFALMPDPAAGPVTIQYQSSDGHFSFLVQLLNTGGVGSMIFGEQTATPTDTVEKKLKTTVSNSALLYVVNRYSGDFVADPIVFTGADEITVQNTGGTSTSGDLTSSIAYEQAMPKQVYDARATWNDNRNVAMVAIELAPASVSVTLPVLSDATGSSTEQTTADWGVTADTAGGTIFAAIRLATDGQLSEDNIENGTGDAVATDTDATPTADDQNGGSFTGLTAGTSYVIDMFQRDGQPEESAVVSSPAFSTASATTDIMAGYGDFSNPALWSIVKTEASVVDNVARFSGTTQSFTRIEITGPDRRPVTPGTVLDLSFDIPRMDAEGRLWINVEPFTSEGGQLGGSVKIYDSDAEGPFTIPETRIKLDAYTVPANAATLEVSLNAVDIGSDYDIDNLMLTY